jgi:hypothetical protein
VSFNLTIIDDQPPYVLQLYPENDSFTNEATVGVFLKDKGSGIDTSASRLELYLDGSPVNGTSEFIMGWLVFKNSSPLTDGNYTAVVTAVDNAGNSKIYSWSFVLDRRAPVIETNITDGALYNGSVVPWVSVRDENLKEYTVEINGEPFRGGAIRTDGTYTLTVEAVDKAGNRANLTVRFTVNGIPHPPSGLTVNLNGSYVELSWLPSGDSDIAGYYVYRDGRRLNDEPVEVTHFRDLYVGSLNYSVTAVDFAGLESDPAYLFPARLNIGTGKLVVGYPALVNVSIENLDGASNGTLALELVDIFGEVIKRFERNVACLLYTSPSPRDS